MSQIAIIGAGLAGLTCARRLIEYGISPTVFERSHRVGGRLASRIVGNATSFDHGAQYFTVRDSRFRSFVDSLVANKAAAEWPLRLADLDDGKVTPRESEHKRYVGVPTMRSVCEYQARFCSVRNNTNVLRLERTDSLWRLWSDTNDDLGIFDGVIFAVPPMQAVPLLPESKLRERVMSVGMSACWAAMATFQSPLDLPFDGAFVHNSILSWVSRNSSKPARDCTTESWVLHASAEWSNDRLEDDCDEVATALLREFGRVAVIGEFEPVSLTAHRWSFAIPPEPLDSGFLFDAYERLGVCGDWCMKARVEGAYISGLEMADHLRSHHKSR